MHHMAGKAAIRSANSSKAADTTLLDVFDGPLCCNADVLSVPDVAASARAYGDICLMLTSCSSSVNSITQCSLSFAVI